MRIIGYIEHPIMKITVFKMDNKRAVKFEMGLLEQTYKWRAADGCDTLGELQVLVDATFVKKVEQQFDEMYQTKSAVMQRLLPTVQEAEFEEII